MAQRWQTVLAPGTRKNAPPGVRRFPVPGGWLYQVEHHVELADDGEIDWIEWFPPVFVPFHGDGQ
jgi:hypothetical protein